MGIKINMGKLKQIISSRWLAFKNRKKDWYKERNRICNSCPLSSLNKIEQTKLDKVLTYLYLKKPFCTICKCPTKYITALPENECSKADIGLTPNWYGLE